MFRKHWLYILLGTIALAGGFLYYATQANADGLPTRQVARAGEPNPFADAPVKVEKWTGVYVGAAYGYGAANGEIVGSGFSLDGLSATGQFTNVLAGARVQIPGSFLVLGARGGYEWSQQEFSVNPGILSVGIDKGWFADALVGVALGTAMPFVGLGHSVMQTKGNVGGTAITGMPDLKGMRYVAGVEYRLPKIDAAGFATPTLSIEGVYTDNDAIPLGGATSLNVTNLQFMGRVNVPFWK